MNLTAAKFRSVLTELLAGKQEGSVNINESAKRKYTIEIEVEGSYSTK